MNFRMVGKAFIAFVSVALVLYGLSGYIETQLGWGPTLLGEAWKLIAIAVGLSLATGFVYPLVRGVKVGDQLITLLRQDMSKQGLGILINASFVTALQAGRKGDKIRVRLSNGLNAEGVIQEYAGTLTPARIQLVETEMQQVGNVVKFQ